MNHLNPRFVYQLVVTGTKSYRRSSRMFLGEYGGNGQNSADCVLDSMQARAGHSFVSPDQSGAEALIVANLAPEGRYIELFRNGVKPHTYLAGKLFGPRLPEWKPLGIEAFLAAKSAAEISRLDCWSGLAYAIETSGKPYKVSKMTIHARSYKMGWKTFQGNSLKQSEGKLVLSPQDCKYFLGGFDAEFPEILVWQDEVVWMAKRNRSLKNLFGYPRAFERIFTHSYEREIVSWIPQSTVGCLTTEAVFIVDDYIHQRNRPWNILNEKHDSFLVEVPDADVEECARISSGAIKSFKLIGRHGEFSMKSSTAVGKNWGKFDPVDNPLGMQEYRLKG